MNSSLTPIYFHLICIVRRPSQPAGFSLPEPAANWS